MTFSSDNTKDIPRYDTKEIADKLKTATIAGVITRELTLIPDAEPTPKPRAPYTRPRPADPEPFIDHYKKNPQELVTYLSHYGGDVVEMIKRFVGENKTDQSRFLARLLVILNDPMNGLVKNEWDGLIEAYKQAKILTVQRAAYEFFGNYQMPTPDSNTNLSAITSFMRFWMAGHNASETTRGRKVASTEPAMQESAELASIISSLNSGEAE